MGEQKDESFLFSCGRLCNCFSSKWSTSDLLQWNVSADLRDVHRFGKLGINMFSSIPTRHNLCCKRGQCWRNTILWNNRCLQPTRLQQCPKPSLNHGGDELRQ